MNNEFEGLKKKEDKKKGFLAWLRERLGFGSRSMGNVSEGARGLNLNGIKTAGALGRGAGMSGKFGAAGAFSFLGGKAAIVTFGLIALAVGTTLYYKNADMGKSTETSMGQTQVASYVPKIMREQNNASSLDIFKQATKGIKTEEDVKQPEDVVPEEPKAQESADPKAIDAKLGMDNKPRLQTDMQFGLSNSVGTDASGNKFSSLGGFGNHMGKFGPSVKGDFAKNDLLKSASGNKLSSMKSQSRPVIAQGSKFKATKGGKKALDQAYAIKSMQMQPNYGKADTARSTMDRAWEGGTGDGSTGLPSGGSGVSDGGSGIVQTPSTLDGIEDTTTPDYGNQNIKLPNYKFETPWASLVQTAMILLMIAALLAGIVSMVAKIPVYGQIIAAIIAGIAALLAIAVIVIGIKLMTTYGQNKLGMIYVIGGGLALAGAVAAIGGLYFGWNMLYSQLLAAAAGIMGMFASMAAGPAMQDSINKQLQEQQSQTSRVSFSHHKYIV
ncbi:MAG: hypothetical protein ACP5SD_02060 [Elusimicrobiales bacterium]